jgi:hypothetical protein
VARNDKINKRRVLMLSRMRGPRNLNAIRGHVHIADTAAAVSRSRPYEREGLIISITLAPPLQTAYIPAFVYMSICLIICIYHIIYYCDR